MSFKAGFVGLIGMPNAGKSTLVNALIGEKVTIVSSKPQTTRKRVLGITGDETFQTVFVDAPGVVRATNGLNEFLENECRSVIADSDVLLAILNLDEKHPGPLARILDTVRHSNKPWAAVITKNDLGTADRVGFIKAELLKDNVPLVITSVVQDPEGAVKDVLKVVKDLLPEAEAPLYDPELMTTENVRDMAAEIIREKCFEQLGEEVPYGLAVKIQKFEENEGRATRITADVVVDKASHRPIVIGEGGRKIKNIGTLARQDIEKLLDNKVFLELFVVVKEKWTRKASGLKEMGYGIQK